MSSRNWTFLTNHARVLFHVWEHPEARLEEIARKVGMSARGVLAVLRDLEKDEIVSREKVGRHLRYDVHLRVLFAVPWRFFGGPPP
jgi:DNA-binding MarR family transcriptional regulator